MWYPSKLTIAQKEERRLAAAPLLQEGRLSQAAVARQMGVSPKTVSRWAKHLRSHGLEGLRRRPRLGRRPVLSPPQWQQVLQQLTQGAQAAGFDTERWTLARIQSLILRRFGVRYHAHYLSERLHQLGWSVQRPAVSAQERNEELVTAWLRGDWPRIKKSLSARSADRLCG